MNTPEGHRRSKKQQIAEYLRSRMDEAQASPELHALFGSALRTRISDINLDPKSDIDIINSGYFDVASQKEVSFYTARRRKKLSGSSVETGTAFNTKKERTMQNVEERIKEVKDVFNQEQTREKRYFIVAIPEEEQTADSGAFCVMNLGGILVSDGFSSRARAEEFIKEWEK